MVPPVSMNVQVIYHAVHCPALEIPVLSRGSIFSSKCQMNGRGDKSLLHFDASTRNAFQVFNKSHYCTRVLIQIRRCPVFIVEFFLVKNTNTEFGLFISQIIQGVSVSLGVFYCLEKMHWVPVFFKESM